MGDNASAGRFHLLTSLPLHRPPFHDSSSAIRDCQFAATPNRHLLRIANFYDKQLQLQFLLSFNHSPDTESLQSLSPAIMLISKSFVYNYHLLAPAQSFTLAHPSNLILLHKDAHFVELEYMWSWMGLDKDPTTSI